MICQLLNPERLKWLHNKLKIVNATVELKARLLGREVEEDMAGIELILYYFTHIFSIILCITYIYMLYIMFLSYLAEYQLFAISKHYDDTSHLTYIRTRAETHI